MPRRTTIAHDSRTLINAVKQYDKPRIKQLLNAGVDPSIPGADGLSAFDHASIEGKSVICEMMQAFLPRQHHVQKPYFVQKKQYLNEISHPQAVLSLSIKERLSQLREKVQCDTLTLESSPDFDEKIQEETLNVLQHRCLSRIGAFLTENQLNQGRAPTLDLYLTAHQLHRIVMSSPDISALRTAIKRFFSEREHFLHGESLDYCHHVFSAANQLCIYLAPDLFASQNPANILFTNTVTEERRYPWMNPINMENNLPAFSLFFRSTTGRIELYECILEQAIANLKRGMNTPDTIWEGTDMRDGVSYSLSKGDLNILKQRATGFKRLVEHSVTLKNAMCLKKSDQNIYEKLHELRQALRRNDAHGGSGSNSSAGEAVYVDIQKFVVWWQRLAQTNEGKRIQEKICQIGHIRLVLDNLFITCEKPNKSSPYPGPCIGQTGGVLEDILSNAQNRKHLYDLGNQMDVRMSEPELDALRQSTQDELTSSFPLQGMSNAMDSHEMFVYLMEKIPGFSNEICDFTFEQLSGFKNFITDWYGILKNGIAPDDNGRTPLQIDRNNLFAWIRLLKEPLNNPIFMR